ncbi:MAG: hypothetical protein AAB353_12085, partial [Candidatus Hydrogenedentota bacterium]
YPRTPEIGREITGLDEATKVPCVEIFHSGTRKAVEVMRAIRELDTNKLSNVISLDTARGTRSRAPWGWIAAAAAAGVVVAAGLFVVFEPEYTRSNNRIVSDASGSDTNAALDEIPRTTASSTETQDIGSPDQPTVANGSTPSADALDETSSPTPGPRAIPPYRRDLLAAFRDAFKVDDNGARGRLLAAAALPLDAAKSIANDPNATVNARLGAAQAIPGDASALYKVVSLAPEDRHAKYRLAQALSGDPARRSEESAALAAFEGQAEDNALPYYMKAQSFLETDPPDIAAALEALTSARGLESASAYALEAAQAHREALIASGTDPAMAELLSAFTVGRWEYDEYLDLATGLMETGARYRDAGDTRTAASIFESVLAMGSQIETGAALTQERQAAYEIQGEAIQALGPLYESVGNTDEATRIAQLADSVQASMVSLMAYFSEMDVALSGMLDQPDISNDTLAALAGAILLSGDLNLLDLIGGFF